MSLRVIANFGATVAVESEEDGSRLVEKAVPMRNLPLLVAGDRVRCVREGTAYRVTELLERSSVLERADFRGQSKPLAANLTHLAIVSANEPGIDSLLIDQFCVAASRAGISAIIVINKSDRLDAQEREAALAMLAVYRKVGYPGVLVDTKTDGALEPLRDEMAGRAVTLVGASGVGKSSIVQCLLPDQEVRIGALSKATGFGSHTTSVTFWYELANGAAIVDSPGVRQYSVAHLSPEHVRTGYPELLEASQGCRFGNCTHTVEPRCAVKEALDEGQIARWRFDNYLKLISGEFIPAH